MAQRKKAANFEVVLEPEETAGFHIYCPALKGCHSYGATKAEALRNIAEAIALWLESAREFPQILPQEG